VGQKTHPTGFRTGVNKSHNAIWFANYGAYSEVLKEDYKIRKFFEKKFESLYSKAGISKLEIKRKVNQLELIIHAARPKAIASETEQTNLIIELKDNLKTLVSDSKQIRIKVLQVARS
jgi:small subunit ribosomal protein S3